MAGAGEDFLWKDMIGDVHAYACAWHPSHRNNNGDHGILILVLQVAEMSFHEFVEESVEPPWYLYLSPHGTPGPKFSLMPGMSGGSSPILR